jgi:hypothetical protein
MGAWGTGIFDNDTACDWAYELEEVEDLSFIEQTLDRVLDTGSEYLEAPEAEEALAAADVIARLRGNWGTRNSYTEVADVWVERIELIPSTELVAKAVSATERIISPPSELLELWEEVSDGPAWKQEVEQLRSRLAV